MNRIPRTHTPDLASQHGGGMLTIVAVLGLLLALVQGSVFYKSRGSAKFISQEKTKVLAQQMAEAGIEANIGDLGRRKTRVRGGLVDTPTYENRHLGAGAFSSTLTTVAMGSAADTVDLVSTGLVGKGSHTVHARLKLRKAMDTSTATVASVVPETTTAITNTNVVKIDTVPPMAPSAMPALTTQPAYTACMSGSAPKCNVCHIPPAGVNSRYIQNLNIGVIAPLHGGHIGDYLSTDGTCDLYMAKYNSVTVVKPETTLTVLSKIIFDTTVAIDTVVKVHILSWK